MCHLQIAAVPVLQCQTRQPLRKQWAMIQIVLKITASVSSSQATVCVLYISKLA